MIALFGVNCVQLEYKCIVFKNLILATMDFPNTRAETNSMGKACSAKCSSSISDSAMLLRHVSEPCSMIFPFVEPGSPYYLTAV